MHGYEDIPSLTEFSFPSTGDDVSDDTTTLEEVISARFCLRTFCCHRSLAISCVCFFLALLGNGFLDGVDLFAEVPLTPLQLRFLLVFTTTTRFSGHPRGFRRITGLQQIFRAYWNQLGFQFTVTTLFDRYIKALRKSDD